MRTVRTKVMKFSELSDTAKQTAIENYRNDNTELFWADENRDTLEKFADIFPVNIKNWSYGNRSEGVYWTFTETDEIENLTGPRLATYIWNNYQDQIYSKKYYDYKKLTDKKILHKRIKSEEIKTGSNKGKFGNYYYSGITIQAYNCPLTGYCMDNEILHPIYEFLKKPTNSTFKELLEDCFNEWIKACNNDIEYQNSDEYIINNIEANSYEFTKDGRRF